MDTMSESLQQRLLAGLIELEALRKTRDLSFSTIGLPHIV